MMAAAVERGGVRAAFMNPGVGAPAPAPASAAVPGGSTMAGAGGSGSGAAGLGPIMPVPMNLFATWEIDRSSPSCVPRYIKPNAVVHVCKESFRALMHFFACMLFCACNMGFNLHMLFLRRSKQNWCIQCCDGPVL